MPTDLKNERLEDDRESTLELVHMHDCILFELIKLPGKWSHKNTCLREFLNSPDAATVDTWEWEEFLEQYDKLLQARSALGMPEMLDISELKLLAKNLYGDHLRRRYYFIFIRGRLTNSYVNVPGPISVLELEQRYQHYQYHKERKHQGLGAGPTFPNWLVSDDYVPTFYGR